MSEEKNHERNYSEEDKEIVRLAVKDMQGIRKVALVLRYWESYTIGEVAAALGLSWSEADDLIEDCIREIRCKYFPHLIRAKDQ
jgi:DNA-directed RNA polymerase specialized sigma24 family protein